MTARVLATDPVAREAFVLEHQDGVHAVYRRCTDSRWTRDFDMDAFLAFCLVPRHHGWRWDTPARSIVTTVLAALTLDELAGLLETPDTRVREAVLFELTRR